MYVLRSDRKAVPLTCIFSMATFAFCLCVCVWAGGGVYFSTSALCQTSQVTSHKSEVISRKSQSKKMGKDQESIQSSTTPDPGYQWESDNVTIRHHKREPSQNTTFDQSTCITILLMAFLKQYNTEGAKSLNTIDSCLQHK